MATIQLTAAAALVAKAVPIGGKIYPFGNTTVYSFTPELDAL